jgi:hypothetical protein
MLLLFRVTQRKNGPTSCMFERKNKNRSRTTSVVVIDKR